MIKFTNYIIGNVNTGIINYITDLITIHFENDVTNGITNNVILV